MLKFIKHHMTGIDGIEIFPLISLCIFVLFFTGLVYYVMRTKNEKIKEISDYPLND